MPLNKRYFIAGTDTGAGKTLVCCALLQAAKNQGRRGIGLKPVAAGSETTGQGERNDDALALQKYASLALTYEQVNPVLLTTPASPHIAAKIEGRTITADALAEHCRHTMRAQSFDLCLVEGAGGWHAPLSEREKMSDFARVLGLPVILVVGLRLGCLNHAFLSAESIRAAGLAIHGWVATQVDPDMTFVDENVASLQKEFPFPLLGLIPYLPTMAPEYAASLLDINKLLAM